MVSEADQRGMRTREGWGPERKRGVGTSERGWFNLDTSKPSADTHHLHTAERTRKILESCEWRRGGMGEKKGKVEGRRRE